MLHVKPLGAFLGPHCFAKETASLLEHAIICGFPGSNSDSLGVFVLWELLGDVF